ncbi:MAG: DEAD/DEAH box helicase [Candidatus Sumerlaeia bacterium]
MASATDGTTGIDPINEVLATLRGSRRVSNNIVHWHAIPAQEARYAPFPERLAPEITAALEKRGIARLYTHQAEAIERTLAGENVVVVTPTASGKTLCYNLPVIQRLIERPEARALYLFPTKALSHDQYQGLYDLTQDIGRDIKVYTFDGDTPAAARRAIRAAGQIVVTNPDMLHTGILPHHTKWIKLFENLDTVVIDELHQYRGVFGSNVANVIRRLRRICEFYGSRPRFICCSATVANPAEMAETLVGAPFKLVDDNGAPRGERVLIMYNPPVVNRELGIRASSVKEARRVALRFLERGLQTIIFARSRVRVEILTTYIRRALARMGLDAGRVRGYRGGYLPNERRDIERGIRDGEILAVISTNALELGIDIGSLQAAVLCGYPGSISSLWQQGGRAGRKQQTSVIVLVGNSSPIDQFLMENPQFLLGASPEHGILNPDNLLILADHLKCALSEIPMKDGEVFGPAHPAAILEYFEEQRLARRSGNQWYWSSDSFPAESVSLRTSVAQNFVIHNTSDNNRVLGEIDYDSAQELIHPQAIYMHQGRTFYVDRLDWDGRKAYVREVKADYYTDAIDKADLTVMHVDQTEEWKCGSPSVSEGLSNTTRQSRRDDRLQPATPVAGNDRDVASSPGGTAESGSAIRNPQSAFHPVLSRNFGDVRVDIVVPKFKKIKFETQETVGYGDIDLPQYEIHTQAAWWTFKPECKEWLEKQGLDLGSALKGLAWLIGNVASLYVMSDPRDLVAVAMVRSTFDGMPAIYLYDRFAGGVGLARRAFGLDRQIFRAALERASRCECKEGCPACVGPSLEMGERARSSARALLEEMLSQ